MSTTASSVPHPPLHPLNRATLTHFTTWIRDTLDPLIARHGPTSLTPDDVLTLHDFFTALLLTCTDSSSSSLSSRLQIPSTPPSPSLPLSALDLRATRIHRAILEICGLATRWPGRLVDLCEELVQVWTVKYGDLVQLRPFLCGRGGRLEGVWRGEGSRARLVERWRKTCPERVSGVRARRRGACGFKAGDWWINTLFAAHAGIIDLPTASSSSSAICHDAHAAYAVLLKDSAEVEWCSETAFTFRCAQNDPGRYKLTAATRRSREPVRILRSHAAGSIWGPRAGVRYEGLYKVSSWSIRSAQHKELEPEELKKLDVIYEIRFERVDEVPMEEVMRRPFAAELDDYSEYQRVKKEGRDRRRGGKKGDRDGGGIERGVEVAVTPGFPLQAASSATSTPMNTPRSPKPRKNILHVPATQPEDVSQRDAAARSRNTTYSDTSSLGAATEFPNNIRNVAPWVDYDYVLETPKPGPGRKNGDRDFGAGMNRGSKSASGPAGG